MTGSFWSDLALGVGAGLLQAWLALVADLILVRPRGGLLREALRLLPDVLRLIRRLAADKTLPHGVRIRLVLLLAYLAIPIDLIPDFVPSSVMPTTPSSSPPCCVASSAAPASTPSEPTGQTPTMDSLPWSALPASEAPQRRGLHMVGRLIEAPRANSTRASNSLRASSQPSSFF